MSVNRIATSNAVSQIVSKPISKSVPTDAPKQLRASDKLELSGLSHLMKTLKGSDVRTDKVADIKAQIENGSYDENAKLDAVLDRVLDEISK
jgi:anti-sigma28 factor (negative regulator of flagellin synthesis)